MNLAKTLKNPSAQLVAVAAVGVIAIYWLVLRPSVTAAAEAAKKTVTGTAGLIRDVATGELVDEDSPYYGTGIIATPAVIANSVSGGLLSRFGSFLGRTAADIKDAVSGSGDPNR